MKWLPANYVENVDARYCLSQCSVLARIQPQIEAVAGMSRFGSLERVVPAWLAVFTLHFLWLRSGTKWTSVLVFFPVFVGLVLVLELTLHRARWGGGLLLRLVLGAVIGYLGCTAAWLIADAFIAPQRLELVRNAIRTTPASFVVETAFAATITGCWIVGALLAGVGYFLSSRS